MGFLLVGTQDGEDKLRAYMEDGGFALPALPDPSAGISQSFGVRAVPTVIVLDASGGIAQTKVGMVTSAELEALTGVGH